MDIFGFLIFFIKDPVFGGLASAITIALFVREFFPTKRTINFFKLLFSLDEKLENINRDIENLKATVHNTKSQPEHKEILKCLACGCAILDHISTTEKVYTFECRNCTYHREVHEVELKQLDRIMG